MRAFKLIGFPHNDGTLDDEAPATQHEKEVHTNMSATIEAPPTTEKVPLDLSILDNLEPERAHNGQGRPPAYSVEEVEKFYQARSRGITWAQINGILPKQFKRPGTLAQSVHAAAERHGMVAQRTKRAPRKAKAAE